ncbi:Oidioi.mRNA.OKI2018_I69.PAR.g9385.t1.cds [Oikopleura dioica]|uniref:Oidioi.mRNA.OKI2018_I69.PAR.g9385.t1.cds n=1 Tax=Oikopleura dioica TaxID=34765 RepID=A0ABN7RSU5_OIKDI|nr:Oidioi.mRNA.OKI2018_I69.PAR.g9385.t1.cds [Oikopleura dioica]
MDLAVEDKNEELQHQDEQGECDDFQEVKDSKNRRLLKIGGAIAITVILLISIIVPCAVLLGDSEPATTAPAPTTSSNVPNSTSTMSTITPTKSTTTPTTARTTTTTTKSISENLTTKRFNTTENFETTGSETNLFQTTAQLPLPDVNQCIDFCGRLSELDSCDGGLGPEDVSICPSRDHDCFACSQGCFFALNGLGPNICAEILAGHESQEIQHLCNGLGCFDS